MSFILHHTKEPWILGDWLGGGHDARRRLVATVNGVPAAKNKTVARNIVNHASEIYVERFERVTGLEAVANAHLIQAAPAMLDVLLNIADGDRGAAVMQAVAILQRLEAGGRV